MEKKYYFRGLGLGIIVTAVIMGIALSGGGKQEKMTDDEVIARAKELGMIEDSALLEPSKEGEQAGDGQAVTEAAPAEKEDAAKREDAAKKDDPVKKDTAAAEQEEKPPEGSPESLQEKVDKAAEAAKSEETEKEKPGTDGEEEKKPPSADTNEMTKQDEDVPKPETEAAKSVTVSSGDGSYTVAKKLAEAGVVASAEAYDQFLCANGYDKKLRPGTYEIPAGASGEQVAKIVTRQE